MTIKRADLSAAQKGSYYTITGAGGDPGEWIAGYESMLSEAGIGKPKEWYIAKGYNVNAYAGVDVGPDAFQPEVTFLMFPLTGLDVSKLALFKLRMEDRWFDDIIENMSWRKG